MSKEKPMETLLNFKAYGRYTGKIRVHFQRGTGGSLNVPSGHVTLREMELKYVISEKTP